MFNWNIFGNINFKYPQCVQSIYQKIPQELNIFVDFNDDESWMEKMGNFIIDWQMFLFLVLTLTVIILVYIIAVKWFKVSQTISLSDNEDDRVSLIYNEFIRKSSEINEILKNSTMFHFNSENYNQFYVVSIGMEAAGNSSLQINEIFDDSDYDGMVECNKVVADIIDRVELQLGNCQKLIPESRPCKTGSRIPLLRSRQR